MNRGTPAISTGRAESARRGVRTAASIIAGVAVLAGAACLLTIPALGSAPENPWAGAILYILAPGLLIPFALWLVSRAAGGSWIEADGEWVRPTGRNLILRLAISGPFLLLALAATLAGWLTDFHRIVLGRWLTGIASAVALAIGVWFGLGFPAVLGACVLAAWLPLQLPRTQGAAVLPVLGRDLTRPPGRPTKRKPRQRRHQRG